MTLSSKILAALSVAAITLGVTMTMPLQVALELPGAIVENTPPSLGYRTGIVTNIVESNNVDVAISGSTVLITASYLFPQYQPMLGDRVYVVKQDGQWFILGTMSGQVNSLAANPSFEDGPVGGTPTNWTITNGSVLAGVPTSTKQLSTSPLSGSYVLRMLLFPTAINSSDTLVASALLPAAAGQVWTGGVYVRFFDHTGPNQVFMSTALRFYNSALVSIGSVPLVAVQSFTSTTDWYLLRPDATSLSGIAPAGTAWVQLEIGALYIIGNTNYDVQIELDYAMLRRIS